MVGYSAQVFIIINVHIVHIPSRCGVGGMMAEGQDGVVGQFCQILSSLCIAIAGPVAVTVAVDRHKTVDIGGIRQISKLKSTASGIGVGFRTKVEGDLHLLDGIVNIRKEDEVVGGSFELKAVRSIIGCSVIASCTRDGRPAREVALCLKGFRIGGLHHVTVGGECLERTP